MTLGSHRHWQTSSFGRLISVDRTRLHYLDCGSGSPVVLLHGNGSRISDFVSSGITERMAPNHRVIAFDRPGFGYSERPRHRSWGPFEQARLLARACARLDIERPVVVGHSWGALVALAWAMQHRDSVAGLVLLSGYYYPIPLARSRPRGPFGNPVLDDAFQRAMLPILGPAWVSDGVRRVFAPCAVPTEFERGYSVGDTLRPSQLKAMSEEADMLMDAAAMMSALYGELDLPVHLIAGSQDGVVDTRQHSARLHEELPASTLRIVPGCGHMVHHAAPDQVVAAVAELRPGKAPSRNWLRLGEDAFRGETSVVAA